MSNNKGKKPAALVEDVPWRASPVGGVNPIPKIHQKPLLRLPQGPNSNYAISIMKHSDPVGNGFAMEGVLEAAGHECIVPGQITPIKLLGLKVWPIEVNINIKFMEPVGKELRNIGKVDYNEQSHYVQTDFNEQLLFQDPGCYGVYQDK